MTDVSHIHHYVPQWYQERFFGDEERKFYLSIKPEDANPYGFIPLKSYSRCFFETDLYMLNFGRAQTDIIETKLFGHIDNIGSKALKNILASKTPLLPGEVWQDLLEYMDAQLSRTPRALRFFSKFINLGNGPLIVMQELRLMHASMWSDGVWEIFDATDSGIEFILSDNPVTLYNRAIYPLSKEGQTGMELNFEELGTQTLLPLDKHHLFVITHTQFARDPSYNPREKRLNPRYMDASIIDMLNIIKFRKLSEQDVIKVNFIIKNRADKYIASSSKDLLFPEKMNKKIDWNNIKKNDFLLPDPRDLEFSTEWIVGFRGGGAIGRNEYGEKSDDDNTKNTRNREWAALQKRKDYYDKRYGPLARKPARWQNSENASTKSKIN